MPVDADSRQMLEPYWGKRIDIGRPNAKPTTMESMNQAKNRIQNPAYVSAGTAGADHRSGSW